MPDKRQLVHRFFNGFLLLELLLALLIFSIAVLPWYYYLSAVVKTNPIQDLNTFFQTKQIFLDVIHGEVITTKTLNQNQVIKVKKTPVNDHIQKLTVNFYDHNQLRHSLVGVAPSEHPSREGIISTKKGVKQR